MPLPPTSMEFLPVASWRLNDPRLNNKHNTDLPPTSAEVKKMWIYIVAYLRHVRIVTSKHAPAITQ
jgi:hypothetical protein